jgi:hypothetical protein
MLWAIVAKSFLGKTNPEEYLDSNDVEYVSVSVPQNVAYRNGWLIWVASTVGYLIIVVSLSMGFVDYKLISLLIVGGVFLPIYLLFISFGFEEYKKTERRVLSPECLFEAEQLKASETRRHDEEVDEILNSPWYIRYPLSLIIIFFSLWFLDYWNKEDRHYGLIAELLVWLIGISSAISVVAMMRELFGFILITTIVFAIGYGLVVGVSSLPVSVAVIIGAVIIAYALKRN